jgi:hypothetical protein
MLEVFLTVDVEIWCDGWRDLDARFPDAFRRYVYGPTPRGDFGLPYQARTLREHGLKGVFFVEPLFATRFGLDPLAEIIGSVADGGHEVQLHLHPEWVDESREPLLPNVPGKRQYLTLYTREEQTALVGKGLELLQRAGGPRARAFRAGSFAFNADTLAALRANRVAIDCSYNASMFGTESGVAPGGALLDISDLQGLIEYPMTVYRDRIRPLRHAQLGACSFAELEGLLWQALETGRRSFVNLSHNFELLNAAKDGPDDIVVRRFQRLCAFLDRHRSSFRVCGFDDAASEPAPRPSSPLSTRWWRTGTRLLEQAYRRTL